MVQCDTVNVRSKSTVYGPVNPQSAPWRSTSTEQDGQQPPEYKTKKPDCNRTISQDFYTVKFILTHWEELKSLEICFKDFSMSLIVLCVIQGANFCTFKEKWYKKLVQPFPRMVMCWFWELKYPSPASHQQKHTSYFLTIWISHLQTKAPNLRSLGPEHCLQVYIHKKMKICNDPIKTQFKKKWPSVSVIYFWAGFCTDINQRTSQQVLWVESWSQITVTLLSDLFLLTVNKSCRRCHLLQFSSAGFGLVWLSLLRRIQKGITFTKGNTFGDVLLIITQFRSHNSFIVIMKKRYF